MIQKNDFIEIEYIGKTDDGIVFDTTDEKTAKDEGFFQDNAKYGPIVICVGQGHVIPGLDKQLESKEIGKEYTIKIEPEDAFGKKSAKLVQLIPAGKFKKNQIVPQPGLQVDIDGLNGIIKTVSGGRILVDFNHPLSGKIVDYKIKINKKIDDDKEKIFAYVKMSLGVEDIEVEINEGKAIIGINNEIPPEIKKEIVDKMKEAISSVKDIDFKKIEKKEAKKEESTPK
jgi:FKBP-type peptidyl-prolyl cis-trans isomerase SlyD